jgi:hypothetical protein
LAAEKPGGILAKISRKGTGKGKAGEDETCGLRCRCSAAESKTENLGLVRSTDTTKSEHHLAKQRESTAGPFLILWASESGKCLLHCRKIQLKPADHIACKKRDWAYFHLEILNEHEMERLRTPPQAKCRTFQLCFRGRFGLGFLWECWKTSPSG